MNATAVIFLSRDAMHKRGLCNRAASAVRLSSSCQKEYFHDFFTTAG